jgi:ribosomal protein S18 acetylase RimI-like enzyme
VSLGVDGVLIRDYMPGEDRDRLRACVVELQEYERGLEASLPRGEEMADAYVAFLLERCSSASGRIFVAEVSHGVVGFVAVLAAVVPESPDDAPTPYAYLSDLVVLPTHRRRGLGRALMEHAEEFARAAGATELRVGVLARNEAAGRLYESSGFRRYHVQLVKTLR